MISEAVILAGGLSKRLIKYTNGKPKWSILLKGRPLINFPISALRSVGVKRFIIVVAKKWRRQMERILKKLGIDYQIVVNRYVERENGFSFLLSRDYVTRNYFYLSMSDHVYSPKLLTVLGSKKYTSSDLVVCGDREPIYVNVAEATKILSDKYENIMAIGKDVKPFTHIDTGVFLVHKRVFKIAEKIESSQMKFTMSDIVNKAVKEHLIVKVATIYRGYWTEIDTPSDLKSITMGHRKTVLEHALRGMLYEERPESYVSKKLFLSDETIT